MTEPTTNTGFPEELLKDVSRSFYQTLRVLPASIRPQIGLAYLLARASDTIADTPLVSQDRRLEALQGFGEAIQGQSRALPDMKRLLTPDGQDPGSASDVVGEGSEGEQRLLACLDSLRQHLHHTAEEDRQKIRAVLEVIIGGQILDLKRFGTASESDLVALEDEDALDDYTYRVAGCVGEFWTRICRAHLFPSAAMDMDTLMERGIRFGKGLQLVNILRDMPRDLRQGRCYLPRQQLKTVGLTPEDLLDPGTESRLRPVYQVWMDRARDHLAAGWTYTNTLPRNQRRLRLACAWPILIGIRTLNRLASQPVLDPETRIKVSRKDIRQIMFRTLWAVPFPAGWGWNRLFDREQP